MKFSRLRAELFLRRTGWAAPAGLLLLAAGLAVHLWWLPAQQSRVSRLQEEHRRLIAQLAHPAPQSIVTKDANVLQASRLAAFENMLALRAATPDLVKKVFAEAQKSGLTLSQAEYHLSEDKNGGFSSYQMVLPVQGPYIKLREFVDGVLADNPSAALEEVAFKRNGIGAAVTETRLRLVFFLKDPTR